MVLVRPFILGKTQIPVNPVCAVLDRRLVRSQEVIPLSYPVYKLRCKLVKNPLGLKVLGLVGVKPGFIVVSGKVI